MFFFTICFTICFYSVYGFVDPVLIEKVKNFEKISEEIVTYCDAPGVAVSIFSRKEILSLRTYGLCNLYEKKLVNHNTLFRIGSLSKICSGALMSKLDTRGIINIEYDIQHYMPNICIYDPIHTSRIKVKHLLSHTSGIAAYSLENKAYLYQNFNMLISDLCTTRKVSEPGKLFHYQNVLFSLIAPVLLSATKNNFIENIKKELLEPLNIVHYSLTDLSYATNSNVAFPYLRKNFSTHIPYTDRSCYDNILPAGGMAFSIKEITKLLQALIGGYPSVLDKKTLDKVLFPRILVKKGCPSCKKKGCDWFEYYGLGCRVVDAKSINKRVIFHYGSLKGFMSGFALLPTDELGIVVLTNSDQSPIPKVLIQYFIKMINGASIDHINQLFNHWKEAIRAKYDKK